MLSKVFNFIQKDKEFICIHINIRMTNVHSTIPLTQQNTLREPMDQISLLLEINLTPVAKGNLEAFFIALNKVPFYLFIRLVVLPMRMVFAFQTFNKFKIFLYAGYNK